MPIFASKRVIIVDSETKQLTELKTEVDHRKITQYICMDTVMNLVSSSACQLLKWINDVANQVLKFNPDERILRLKKEH